MAVVDVGKDLPDNYKFGWEDKDAVYRNVKKKGLSEDVVREISQTYKQEPDWMLQRRLKALKHYRTRSMPTLCVYAFVQTMMRRARRSPPSNRTRSPSIARTRARSRRITPARIAWSASPRTSL